MRKRVKYLNEQEILAELKCLVEDGVSITQQSLVKHRRSDLLNDIRRISSLLEFQKIMGLKHRKIWTKEGVSQAYKLICDEMKMAPSAGILSKTGRADLVNGIKTHFGRMSDFREEIGIDVKRKPGNYWTYETVICELKAFCLKHQTEIKESSISHVLEKYKRSDLAHAILKYGGIGKLIPDAQIDLKFRKMGGWTEEGIMEDLKTILKLGHVINQNVLRRLNRNDLLWAVYKYGGMNYFKSKLGLKIQRQNYWSEELIIEELKPIVASFNRIPSGSILKSIGKGGLLSAMNKRGTFKKFSVLLNTRSSGYYISRDGHFLQSAYECIFDNILYKYNIPHYVHVKFSKDHKYLCDFLIQDTYIEIAGFFRNSRHEEYFKNLDRKILVYQELGKKYLVIGKAIFCENIDVIEKKVLDILGDLSESKVIMDTSLVKEVDIRPVTYWANLNNIKTELQPLVKKYGRMPLDAEFRKERKLSLVNGIYKYYGSYFEIGKLLGIKVLNKPKGFYSFRHTIDLYSDHCKKAGRYLMIKDLKIAKLSGLLNGIARHGGLFSIIDRCNLNFPKPLNPVGYYTEETAIAEYTRVCAEKGEYLGNRELIAAGFRTLAGFIQRHVGYTEMHRRTELGFAEKSLRYTFTVSEIVDRYKQLCIEHGSFLTKRVLSEKFSSREMGYITDYIGLKKLREMTNLNFRVDKIRPKKFYNEDMALAEYKQLCIDEDYFLSMKHLMDLGKGKLARFIGIEIGYPEVRKLTGLNLKLKSKLEQNTILKARYDKSLQKYKELCIEHGHFLSCSVLKAIGLKSIANAIKKNGGYYEVRKACNLDFPVKSKVVRTKPDAIISEYHALCLERGYFLSATELIEHGFRKLSSAIIYRYGFNKIRKITGLKLETHKKVKPKTLDTREVLNEFRRLSIERRAFLAKNDFIALGMSKVAWFIQNNGGYRHFQKLSGLDIHKMNKQTRPRKKRS